MSVTLLHFFSLKMLLIKWITDRLVSHSWWRYQIKHRVFTPPLSGTEMKVREAPFWNVLVLYGHCPNSFRPSPLCQMGRREKSAQNHPGKPLHSPPFRQCPLPPTHFKKGLPLANEHIRDSLGSNVIHLFMMNLKTKPTHNWLNNLKNMTQVGRKKEGYGGGGGEEMLPWRDEQQTEKER